MIAAGAVQFSDPVELEVRRWPTSPSASICPARCWPLPITGRYARQTNYISPPGDFTGETVMPVGNLTDQWFFLCGVDVAGAGRGAAASSRSATR